MVKYSCYFMRYWIIVMTRQIPSNMKPLLFHIIEVIEGGIQPKYGKYDSVEIWINNVGYHERRELMLPISVF